MKEAPVPREGYSDDVRTRQHAEVLADAIEKQEVFDNAGWPMVALFPVLPSARDLIVRALREISKTMPEN
jgi:hypothetical protein